MVYGNLSDEKASPFRKKLNVAPVFDRVLASLIDFFLLSPFLGLVSAPVLKKMQRTLILENGTQEFLVFSFVIFLLCFALVFLYQVVSFLTLKATPGQKSLKLVVTPIEHKQLTFGQAVTRALMYNFSLLALGLPFLEILSHPRRRLMHDRASDTEVLTTKTHVEEPPHWLEVRFIRQIYVIVFLVFGLLVYQTASKLYNAASKGEFKRASLEKSSYLCTVDRNESESQLNSLDLMISSVFVGSLSKECLLNEADFVFWNGDESQINWAYLAKGFYYYETDRDLGEKYFDKVCSESSSELCNVANRVKGQYHLEGKTENQKHSSQYLISKILDFKESRAFGNYNKAFAMITELKDYSALQNYVQHEFVKVLWARGKKQESQGAFLNIIDENNKVELSAWMCHREMDKACQDIGVFCDALADVTEDNFSKSSDPFIATALIKYLHCKGKDTELSARVSRIPPNDPIKIYYDMLMDKKTHSELVKNFESVIGSEFLADDYRVQFLKDLALKIQTKEQQLQTAELTKNLVLDTYSKYEVFKQLTDNLDKALAQKNNSKARQPASFQKPKPTQKAGAGIPSEVSQ